MRLDEVLKMLDGFAPFKYAESWDNVGLIVGTQDRDIKTVLVAVDATDEVIQQGVKYQADLILTHHPLVFKPLKKVLYEDFIGKRIISLIKNDISYAAMHTNFDQTHMAIEAAKKLGLRETVTIAGTGNMDVLSGREYGFGAAGFLNSQMSLEQFASLVKEAFSLSDARVFGRLDKMISKAAVIPGSGGSLLGTAIEAGADIVITGDISHHEGIDAIEQGFAVIDAGHFGIEKLFKDIMISYFKDNLPGLKVYAAEEAEPYIALS
ncbi:MAG: Nif3-like dinuclear metal center hexameric protein [Lachnospiraceae bacterium]|nr:Nif3-like dinuclear metal center hexameric protein [Lachnospiraceae bacterium]